MPIIKPNIQITIPDGSITTPKLADGAVTTPKIADGSVTTTKFASDAVAPNATLWNGGQQIISSADPSGTAPDNSIWFKYI